MMAVYLALPVAASAASPPPNGGALADVRACRAIAASDQRLACYDTAVAALDTAVAKHDITILDRQEVVRTRRSLFGFQLPNLKLFGGGEREVGGEDQATLDSTVQSVRPVSYGKWTITIPEGAVWQNTDLMDYAPQPGEKVHLTKGLMGSFFMRIGSNRPVRAIRVR
jgi:hypothetical protein